MPIESTKKINKLTVEEVAKRTKARVDFPEGYHRTYLCGSPVEMDANGKRFAIIPGFAEHLKQLKDLHPAWTISEPYVDMED